MDSFGRIFRITTYGGSHSGEIGAEIRGCPSGLEISLGEIQYELDRRKPAQNSISTQRREMDQVEVRSGIIGGKTTGGTINLRIRNTDVDLGDYETLERKPRPGHADYTWFKKYGNWYAFDRTGGRETAGRVATGAVAKKLIRKYGIDILGYSVEIAGIRSKKSYYLGLDPAKTEEYREIIESNQVRCIDAGAAEEMRNAILNAREEGDSVGGTIEIMATGVPAGVGEPIYNKLSAALYFGFGSIPAVTDIAIGLSGRVGMPGSRSNDEFYMEDGKVKTRTNYCGGILGGISDGMPIVARIGFKPTPSISRMQATVDLEKMEGTNIKINGRHDPCIVPRAVPVVEAMMSLILADQMLLAGYIPRSLI